MNRHIPVILFLFAIVFPSLLSAQEANQKQMEDSVLKAAAAFEKGQFLEAAENYADAFQFYNDYNLKKNEMIAWFKSGNCSPALSAAGLFLEKGKAITDDDRTDVKSIQVRCELSSAKKSLNLGNIEGCESHLNSAEAIIHESELPPVQGSEESREIDLVRKKLRLLKEKKSEQAEEKEEEGSYLGPFLAGSGYLLSMGGIIMIASSVSAETDLQCTKNISVPSCDNPKEITQQNYNNQLSDIETLNTIGWVTTIVGLVVMGTGGVLWFEDNPFSFAYSPQAGSYRVELKANF